MSLEVEPAEGMVALRILEDVDGDEEDAKVSPQAVPYPTAEPIYNEALIALCVGAGRKVTICKRGDTVLVDKWARNGLHIDDDTVVVEAYCVKAKVVG